MTTSIGDLIITFQGSRPTVSRAGAFRPVTEYTDGSRLWICPTAENWKGSPIQVWTEDGLALWGLGEFVKSKAGIRDIQNWPGHFIVFGRDDKQSRWHVWTNRMGTFHAYYGWDGQRGALATFAPAVAAMASQQKLDWEGLCGFFGFGFFPSDRTHWQDVRIVRPATHLVFDSRGKLCHQERTWRWNQRPDTRRSCSDTVDEYAHLFETILDEQTHGKSIALPISGGLDSRSTVAALTRPAAPASPVQCAYSYGYSPDSMETRIAGKIAAARHLPFSTFTIQPYLFDQINWITACLEGFQDITQCRQAAVVAQLGASTDHVVAAHWGDVWHDTMGIDPACSPEQIDDFALHKILKPGSSWLLQHCAPFLPGHNGQALLRDFVVAELAQLSEFEDSDFRVKAFKTEQWSFRWTLSSLRMFQSHLYPLLPFYDPGLGDFFCTVPTAYLRGRQLQIDALKRFAPDLARIDWQPYGANLYLYRYFNSLLLPKRAVQKALRLIRSKPVIQRNWEVQFLCDTGKSGLKTWLLTPRLKILDLFPKTDLAALIEKLYAHPDRETGYALSMLLTFSAWLECYG